MGKGVLSLFGQEETLELQVRTFGALIVESEKMAEELQGYKDTGLTPDKIREIDDLYTEKCREVAGLEMRAMAAEQRAAELQDALVDASERARQKAEENAHKCQDLEEAWQKLDEQCRQLREEKDKLQARLDRMQEGTEGGIDDTREEETEEMTKKRPLDIGKCRALRKAGWTLKQIGDEMGCSAQTIANALKKDEKEKAD